MGIREIITLSGVPHQLRMACFAAIGVVAGSGLYVARISNATSYLSDEPEACINCHIMKPYYASWQHSSHARVATCNDCHVPHESTFAKYAYKAKDGMRHSTIFTLRMEPQVLRATTEAQHVIQNNCMRCHGNLLSEVNGFKGHQPDRQCIECHRETPHGRTTSLSSTPNTLTPPLKKVGFGGFKNPENKENK